MDASSGAALRSSGSRCRRGVEILSDHARVLYIEFVGQLLVECMGVYAGAVPEVGIGKPYSLT
jgi:hypothetical protein